MLYFQLIAVVAVFAAIAWLATGRGGQVGETYPDRPDVALPDDRQLRKDDVDAARFTVGWRGYRMDEVDAVLDRLANELEYRDRLIAELLPPGGMAAVGTSQYASDLDFQPPSRAVAGVVAPEQAGQATQGEYGQTFENFQGYGETVYGTDPASASAPTQAVQQPEAAAGDEADPDEPDDENPLSRWYRKPQ